MNNYYYKKRTRDSIFTAVITILTVIAVFVLAFVVFFIIKEAMPLFKDVSIFDFLCGDNWMPIDYLGTTSFGIRNFILGTIGVSAFAILIALIISLGTALFLAFVATQKMRNVLYPFIDLLAGIPSVVYGFIGLEVLVKLFLKMGVHTGSCVLCAAIILAVMLLPYMISSFSDSLIKSKKKYLEAGTNLGIDYWYSICTVVIPVTFRNMLLSTALAVGRAMGETMAVMMVMGNANLFPRLLGKGESIASLIALEMGTAVVNSTHYHALYAAGLVLMLIVIAINLVVSFLGSKLNRE